MNFNRGSVLILDNYNMAINIFFCCNLAELRKQCLFSFPKVCVQRGTPYIVASYDVDTQLAILLVNGYADFVMRIQTCSSADLKR